MTRGAFRQAWPFALISGGVVLGAFLALPPQSLPGKYAAGDAGLLFPFALLSLLAAGLGIAAVLWWRSRGERGASPWQHLVVPPLLAVLIPLVLVVCGGARSRWETGLLCAAVAAGAHLAVALPRARWRILLCGVLAAGALTVVATSQTRWRAEDFRATRLPFVVADVPGYELTSTYADVGVIILTYRHAGGATLSVDVRIAGLSCTAARPAPALECLDLDGGHHLAVSPPYPAIGDGPPDPAPEGVTFRPSSAAELASYPVSRSSLPD